MAGVDVFFAVLVDVAVSGQCGSWLMGVEEEEAVALMTDEVMGGGWSTAVSLGQREGCLLDRLLGATTYPAMPTDCGSCNDAFSASQYAGVTRSMPSRIPTSTRIGVNCPVLAVAKDRSLSS